MESEPVKQEQIAVGIEQTNASDRVSAARYGSRHIEEFEISGTGENDKFAIEQCTGHRIRMLEYIGEFSVTFRHRYARKHRL